jgi:hypothetical protein
MHHLWLSGHEILKPERYFIMRKLKVIRLRDEYRLVAPNGEGVRCGDYAELLQAAVKTVFTDKELTVYDQSMLIDELRDEEPAKFAAAIASIPELRGYVVEEMTTVFCEMTGEPIHGKQRFYELAAEENRLATEEFEAKYGPDADEDEVEDD